MVTCVPEWNLSDFNDAQRHVSDVQYNALAVSVPDNVAHWATYAMDSRFWTSSITCSRLQDMSVHIIIRSLEKFRWNLITAKTLTHLRSDVINLKQKDQ